MKKEQAQLDALVVELRKIVPLRGWNFQISKGQRGWCHTKTKLVTVPAWAFDIESVRVLLLKRGFGVHLAERYAEYYLAHEASHAHKKILNHGANFMAELKRICHPDIIQLELGYKPRNAAAAGIKKG